jgi:CHAD domain-containing protein
MGYRFRKRESPADAALRIAESETGRGIRRARGLRVSDVHAARRSVKRLRALLRLVRAAHPNWRGPDREARAAARELSAQRDSDVAPRTLERVGRCHRWALKSGELERIRHGLDRHLRQERSRERLEARLRAYRRSMRTVERSLPGWDLSSLGTAELQVGFARTLEKVQISMPTGRSGADPAQFHRWRRHVKYHLMHLRLLRSLAGEDLRPRARLVRRLEKILGEHHDLVVLDRLLRACDGVSERQRDVASELIKDTQATRALQALRLGERICDVDPAVRLLG